MSERYTINDSDTLVIEPHDPYVTVFLRSSECSVEYRLRDGDFHILVFQDHPESMKLTERGCVENGTAEIKYLELDRYDLAQDTNIEVKKGSSLEVQSICLGTAVKKIDFNLVNAGSDSSVRISNNIVCLDDSSFTMNVIGKIVSEARRAKCHQKSRCLTIGSPKKAEVKPVLLIDNNDVEASHSLSSGTIDDEVLFYMNARGLSEMDALRLLLRSYLIPDESFYDGFADGEMIREEAKRKVDDLCSM